LKKNCPCYSFRAGLPDFSSSKHTKMGKYTKWPQTIPNGCKIHQVVVPKIFHSHRIYHHSKALRNKTTLGFFGMKICKPSGKPGFEVGAGFFCS
jgi:hypothetical protein